jgi:hypothetical protein
MFRFKPAGRKEEENLDLGPRLLREMGPVIEDHLTREVGWAQVERGRLGRSLRVKVNPNAGNMRAGDQVREEIGVVILENLMAMALNDPTSPVISTSGNLAMGGRKSAERIGL